MAAVRGLRRVRPRVRRRRPDPGHDGRHPLVPRPALGRAVGRLDRSVGGRHRAHAGCQVADRRPRPGGGDADPRRRLDPRHPAVRPVARPPRPRPSRLAARRRAGAGQRRPPCRPACRSPTRCAAASSPARRSPTRSCSAPRSAASSSSSSSSRTAPTRRTAAVATTALAGMSVVARLAGGRIVSHVPIVGFTASLAVLQVVALALLAFAGLDGNDLPGDHPVRRHRRQPPDAAAAADRRALRRPRLPPHLQPRPVHLHGRHGRRPAAARVAVRQRRRLRDVLPRRRRPAR